MTMSILIYNGDLQAASAKPKTTKHAAAATGGAAALAGGDCIATNTCATLRPEALGDVVTLRPGKDNIGIRAARDPENFLTMKAVPLGLSFGECGDIKEANKPIAGDTIAIAPSGDGGYVLSLKSGTGTLKLQATLSAQRQQLGGTDQIVYLSGNYQGTLDTYKFAAYLLDRKSDPPNKFQKQYRLEIFDSKCIAARPETPGNIAAQAPVAAMTTRSMVRTARKIPCEGPIGQGGQPPWPG
jgi:hypothetical protein